MSIASEITRITGNIADAYTAASAKGATLPATQNSANLATTISSISGGSGKYQLLDRVKDDTNTEIGTVVGFHKDASDNEYAVVALDAQYRLASGQYLSENVEVTGLALLANQTLWDNADTATSNCTKILDFADANNYTSTAVSHCRSKSFVVDNTTYYGQLPTIVELVMIFMNRTIINSKDTSATQYSSLIVPTNSACWSSTQRTTTNGLYVEYNGLITHKGKNNNYMVLPILELPNA